ncbi:iron complex transport system ATP-binding protein [Steroidobacter denitrificans]|uniref:Iron complex transport system ATP-binding protein n=1 Tax=Steroidobacter denitrificans TaxID=465721 RepID=A0A127F5X5_STEDE|nr:ABC transporter ATP-binding protein [Steroidobacter denitrificans]AMN45827.1 iron complex transport system ATP-binding protein [Steroidobacter denitrificans]
MNAASALLTCHRLTVEVAGHPLVHELELSVHAGTMTCILGRNGTGKTLTLHTLAGLRAPAGGEIKIGTQRIDTLSRRELALSLGLLLQGTEDPFPSSVLDTVLVGRHPHIGFWAWENENDRVASRAALAAVGMESFAQRDVATLSGGERRRVAIASLLAQNPDLFLLDEPLNHLDPHHQMDVLKLMKERTRAGHAVMMSLHDAGLAARFADHALLLFGGGEWLSGPSREVLTEETISRLYGVPVREIAWAQGRTFVVA